METESCNPIRIDWSTVTVTEGDPPAPSDRVVILLNGSQARYLLATPEREAAGALLVACKALVAAIIGHDEGPWKDCDAVALQVAQGAIAMAEGR